MNVHQNKNCRQNHNRLFFNGLLFRLRFQFAFSVCVFLVIVFRHRHRLFLQNIIATDKSADAESGALPQNPQDLHVEILGPAVFVRYRFFVSHNKYIFAHLKVRKPFSKKKTRK